MSHTFVEGHRASFDGALCTVRYVGDIKGTKGAWLGVEWDNPSRGKHSGEHQGVKYFNCKSKHPTAGSFVRPSRPSDSYLSFLEALHEKYASELVRSEQAGREHDDSIPQSSIEISGKVVEEVGFERVRKQLAALHELQIVILDGLRIQGALPQDGNPSQREDELRKIATTCPKVAELDISRNLFHRWQEVEEICSQLKLLRSLRLNGNRFESVDGSFTFGGISKLSVDETLIRWENVAALTFRFPSLTTLSVSTNEFSSISTPISSTITKLTLENNHFESFSSIRCLAALPNLIQLSLQGNRIRRVLALPPSPPDEDEKEVLPRFSSSLTSLDISRNEISSWSLVNTLPRLFPGLESLRISDNPLYKQPVEEDSDTDIAQVPMTVDESYMLTLSRLSSLKTLNYTVISPQDRNNGELYYLSLIGKELSRSFQSEEQVILNSHPRYHELCEAHGTPVVKRAPSAESGGVNPKSLEARLITFNFYLAPSSSPRTNITEDERASRTTENPNPTVYKIEVPRSFDIYRVKAIVSRLFSLPPLRFKLLWETEEWDPVDETKVGEDEWDSDEDGDGEDEMSPKAAPIEASGDGNKFVRREVELTDSTREIGFWFSDDAREANVRVEL